jgi:hypothetical protein
MSAQILITFLTDAPARMRRELDKVLALQTQIEAVEQSIHDAKKSLTGQTAVADSLVLLGGLEKTHAVLSEQADRLYSTLNIHKDAPELQGLPLAFVRILHAARDLKAHIQDRGQKSIDELLNLRQAVAGQKEPSGECLSNASSYFRTEKLSARDKTSSKHHAGHFQSQACSYAIYCKIQCLLRGTRGASSAGVQHCDPFASTDNSCRTS